jgi:hypothetical protein
MVNLLLQMRGVRSLCAGLVLLTTSPGVLAQYPTTPGAQNPAVPPAAYSTQPGMARNGYPATYATQPGMVYPATHSAYAYPTPKKTRSMSEMSFLYATSVIYGVGLGVEVSSEIGIKDPGLFLIAPALLGVAAPIGAYALDQPKMRRGIPTAIGVGLLLGAGEGLGIAGTQMVSAGANDAWKFRGLSRSMALGATVGGVGGWLAGTWLEPPPNTTVLAMSGALWGTAIGSMFGYGTTPGDHQWRRANDQTAVAGLIGYNVGALGAAATGFLSTVSERQLLWMWSGAGIGAAASLPIFLLYAGDGGPPARRGFVFMGTATTLGIVAGALFASGGSSTARAHTQPGVAFNQPMVELAGVFPYWSDTQGGLVAVGTLR